MADDEPGLPARRTGRAEMDSPFPPGTSFADAFSALTPPGADPNALTEALKAARRPVIALPASDEDARHYSLCPRCDTVHDSRVLCADETRQATAWMDRLTETGHLDKADRVRLASEMGAWPPNLPAPAASLPADPFTAGDLRATALSQFWHESVEAGIPVESVDRIIGVMLAEAHGGGQA